jgi:hypothetical protein
MESKPYLDWQWEGRPAEGDTVQILLDDEVTVGWWIEEDAGDRENEEHLITQWYCLNNRLGEIQDIEGVPDAWKPLDPPPPLEFGWEVGITTAVYHNGEFQHNCNDYCTVIAPTSKEARARVVVPADKEVTLSNGLVLKTVSFINSSRFLGRKVERVVVEFIKDED